MESRTKRTPLFEGHRALGARLVDFAGWDMPLQYSGVVDEYQTVRRAAGLFDVSHMGRIAVTGDGALAFLQRLTTNDASKLDVMGSQYSMVCNAQGGIKDDIFVYRLKPAVFLLCVNASNREKILAWLLDHAKGEPSLTVQDHSEQRAQLAVQGPAARRILLDLGVAAIQSLKPRQGFETSLLGAPAIITRTGYTGELGYELYVPADQAMPVWQELLTRGKVAGLKPAGLGARDLLRLEMAYLLYGNDISEETTPLEAQASWVVAFEKGDFIGREALHRQRQQGVRRQLVALELVEKAVPRHGCRILETRQGEEAIGVVTSGNLSPILQKGIGLGYVPPSKAAPGTSLTVDIRGRRVPALVVKPPFYTKQASG